MKVLVALVGLVFVVQSKPLTEDEIRSITKSCVKESNMDIETLKRISSPRNFPRPTNEYLKFLQCTYMKQGYLDRDGLISYELIENFVLDYYDANTVKLALEPCAVQQKGRTGGERAYHTAKCIITNLDRLEEKNDIIESTTLNSFYD